jgi:hypothetical protein
MEYKEVLLSPSWHTCQILNHSKQTQNEEDTGLKLETGTKIFSQIFWSKLSLILFLCFLGCSFTADTQTLSVDLQFVHPMTHKSLNLVEEWKKYWKVLNDKYKFGDEQFYPTFYWTTLVDFGWFWVINSIHLVLAIQTWREFVRWFCISPCAIKTIYIYVSSYVLLLNRLFPTTLRQQEGQEKHQKPKGCA